MHMRIVRLWPLVALFAIAAPAAETIADVLPRGDARRELEAQPDLADRINWMNQLKKHRVGSGLQQKAVFKLNGAELEAAGLSAANQLDVLVGQRAFPFAAQPQLSSTGNVRTITLPIDFADFRAASVLPGLTADNVKQNLYGSGSPTAQRFVPYESLRAYYKRASEGKLDIDGDVIGWVHFPKKRAEYEPKYPRNATEDEKIRLRNQALFDLISSALRQVDAQVDFSRYDNNHDGNIDILNIIYAGPNTGWGSFWWAYQWSFFVADAANKLFDDTRLKQFIFQFAEQREGGDFNPKTFIHETGHALGLPDLYDYCSKQQFTANKCGAVDAAGEDGGVGGLDMMDWNWGNHNALSRWLLDWIVPVVIGPGPQRRVTIAASGAVGGSPKAVALFPGLRQTNAPGQELFVIEYRKRAGNDGGAAEMPADGLLVWHVDSTPAQSNDGFSFDNSYSPHKLIRLVRAQSASDFGNNDSANALDYYAPGHEFTPHSTPSTTAYSRRPTHIFVKNIAFSGDKASFDVGFETVVATGPKSALEPRATRAGPSASSAVSDSSLANLVTANTDYSRATAEELAAKWPEIKSGVDQSSAATEAKLRAELLLTTWAGKAGLAAVDALLALPDAAYVRRVLPRLMLAWVVNDPKGANDWYFSQSAQKVREGAMGGGGNEFTTELFYWRSQSDPESAAAPIDQLKDQSEIVGAVAGLQRAAELAGVDKNVVETRLKRLGRNAGEAMRNLKPQ